MSPLTGSFFTRASKLAVASTAAIGLLVGGVLVASPAHAAVTSDSFSLPSDQWVNADDTGTGMCSSSETDSPTNSFTNWKSYCTQIYNLNGGTDPSGLVPTSPVKYYPGGCGALTPDLTSNPPLKPGYTFKGWSANSGTSPVSPSGESGCPLGGAVNRYMSAIWQAKSYSTTFDWQGADTHSGYLAQSKSYETTVNVASATGPGKSVTKSGFTFDGWAVTYVSDEDGATVSLDDIPATGGSYTQPMGPVTLTAKWVEQTSGFYLVAVDLDGGTTTATIPSIASAGDSVELPGSADMSKTGFTFDGWSVTASTGTVIATMSSDGGTFTVPDSNVTATAQWVSNDPVTDPTDDPSDPVTDPTDDPSNPTQPTQPVMPVAQPTPVIVPKPTKLKAPEKLGVTSNQKAAKPTITWKKSKGATKDTKYEVTVLKSSQVLSHKITKKLKTSFNKSKLCAAVTTNSLRGDVPAASLRLRVEVRALDVSKRTKAVRISMRVLC